MCVYKIITNITSFHYIMESYNVYSNAVGGKSWNGESLKEYTELPKYIQDAWSQVETAIKAGSTKPVSVPDVQYLPYDVV